MPSAKEGHIVASVWSQPRIAHMTKSAKAETLRLRIALYRSYLRDGVSVDLARRYLKEIAAAETILAKLAENDRKPSDDEPHD